MSVRVLIADDHPVFLEGLRLLLDSADGIQVVGAAEDGRRLVELAEVTPFDVAVVDLDMPGLDGGAATRQLLHDHPGTAVLVLTMHDDPQSVDRALRAGARGYLLKGARHGAVVRAIAAVAEGETVFGGTVGRAVVEAATAGGRPRLPFPDLTAREGEVLELVARGSGNAAIAAELHLSLKTVQNHVSALVAKTGSVSRAELVARARDAGVGSGPDSAGGPRAAGSRAAGGLGPH